MAEVLQLTEANEKALAQINGLLRQFRDKETSLGVLQRVVADTNSELWTTVEEGSIVGMATLTLASRLAGISARIEDVVVEESHRGRGLGTTLCKKLIERAKERGAYSVHLTSNPSRVAANALYQKLGFQKRDTNAYRLEL